MARTPAERVLLTWAQGRFPSARLCTKLPANVADVLPAVRVNTVTTSTDRYGFEAGSVDMDVYDTNVSTALDFTVDLIDALTQELPGQMVGDTGVLEATARDLGPTPYDDSNIGRRTVVVQIRLHTRSAA